MILLDPMQLELRPEELAREARARFGQELRRLGVFTQLCLLGAETCLERSGTSGSLGVLLATAHGARSAVQAALAEVMPFTFIATQTHLAGALLARRHAVVRASCVYLEAEDWPGLQRMAQAWLAGCERVALGWVEEAGGDAPHVSRWQLAVRDSHRRA